MVLNPALPTWEVSPYLDFKMSDDMVGSNSLDADNCLLCQEAAGGLPWAMVLMCRIKGGYFDAGILWWQVFLHVICDDMHPQGDLGPVYVLAYCSVTSITAYGVCG